MMTRVKIRLFALTIVPALAALLAACGGGGSDDDAVAFGLRSDVVVPAENVSEIAFAPDGRIFFAEQFTGAIRIILPDGTLQQEPFATLDVADYINLDWGLTGLALHPDFESNGFVYAFYSEPDIRQDPPTAHPAIVRFTDQDGAGTDRTLITDDFPETSREHPGFNANGKIHFGPDGFLYASIGDYDEHGSPSNPVQDLSTPIGKLLRLDPTDGSAPPDNPFVNNPDADPRIYAVGFREPFGFTFHPETGAIYATDNTTVSCEELNIIEPGGNYGWPSGEFPYDNCSVGTQGRVIHHFSRDGMEPNQFLSFVEASALAFAPAAAYPSLGDSLIVCESWRSITDDDGNRAPGVLRRLVLGGPEADQVTASDRITEGCRGTVSVSPDGVIYYSNDTEIRTLTANGGDGGDDNGVAPTQAVPPLSTP